MQGIRKNTLEKTSPFEFFWKNFEFNFLFHPRYWNFKIHISNCFTDSRSYSFKEFKFSFLFIHCYFPHSLVRKHELGVRTSLLDWHSAPPQKS